VSTRPNPNIYPDGGYLFTEGDGTRFRGESWRDLTKKVKEYRQRNKLPAGDPETEIFDQYCVRMPSQCRNFSKGPTVIQQPMDHNQRILHWFIRMLELRRKGPLPKVSDGEAARRAAICAKCPRQQPLVASCQTCINSVRKGREALMDREPSKHQNLEPCSALAEDCMVTVHLEQPVVAADRVPPECWRK